MKRAVRRGRPFFVALRPARLSISPLPGREGLGVGTAEALGGFLKDVLHGAVRIGEYLGIPQSQHAPALRLEIPGAAGICLNGGKVVAAVQFYR